MSYGKGLYLKIIDKSIVVEERVVLVVHGVR
jgi:hypothetical protein